MNYSGYSGKLTNSKIESFLIRDYNTELKAKACIKKYTNAFNKLNDQEKLIFYKTFIEDVKDEIILEECGMCSNDLNKMPAEKCQLLFRLLEVNSCDEIVKKELTDEYLQSVSNKIFKWH